MSIRDLRVRLNPRKWPGAPYVTRVRPANLGVTVDQGKFVVNSVDRMAKGRGFAVFEADCHSKYPEIAAYGAGEVLIGPSERSLHLDESAESELTRITLPRKYDSWNIMAEGGRYSVRVIVWENRRGRKWAYQKEEEDDVPA